MGEGDLQARSGVVGWLAAHRQSGGLILMIAGIAVAALPVWLGAKYGTELLGIIVLSSLIAALFLFFGVLLRFRPEGFGSPEDEAQLTVLGLGGLTGLSICLLGLVLCVRWWDSLKNWLSFGNREGAWLVLLAIAVVIAGLALMFVSLSSARSEEHSSPVLRRLLYGYNAILTGILLFLILAIVNVFAYLKLPNMVDSTETGMFKISDRSKQILRSLNKPTNVYLLMNTRSDVYDEMRTLLSNAQDYTPYLKVETFSTGISRSEIRELQKKYPEIVSDGVLIVYGEQKNAPYSFIKSSEIVKQNFSGRDATETFEGESRLMTELAFLSENKQKPIIYFAQQTAGEMDLNDSDPKKETGIGILKSRLEKRNFEVRPLRFDPTDPKVPDDATMVVIANPKRAYSQPVVNALQKYLDERKGKLVALFDTPRAPGVTTMPSTGLEGLLAGYQVELSKERALIVPVQVSDMIIDDPESPMADFARSAIDAKNPVAVAFQRVAFPVQSPRVVRPLVNPNPQAPSNYRAATLVETMEGLPVWAEADLAASPTQLIQAMLRDRSLLQKKISRDPLSLAVTVTESAAGSADSAKPRMAIFGFANFISNPRMDETRGGTGAYFDFFASTLEWLRERPSNIGIEPRTYKNYQLDQTVSIFKLMFLPAILTLVGIIGLGAGVWVVRRR